MRTMKQFYKFLSSFQKKHFNMLVWILSGMMLLICQNSSAQFTRGNLVVYRVGDGVSALSSAGTAVFLDEYTTAGSFVQSVALPTVASGSNASMVASGTASSEGLLNRSEDRQYLITTGYYASIGAASVASSTLPRVIAVVDKNENINTSTALTNFSSGNNFRSATSTNGTDLWGAGGANGICYATIGSTTATILTTSATNFRQVNIYNGQLYATSGSGTTRLVTVGAGLPNSGTPALTQLNGIPIAAPFSPYSFFMASVSGHNVIYTTNSGSIDKYYDNAGTWTLSGTVSISGPTGIIGSASGTSVSLYISTPTGIFALTDNTDYNGVLSGTPSSIAAPSANTYFRGLAFSPELKQTITFAPIIATVGDADFTPSASATSGGSLTFSSDNASVATITGDGKIHIVGEGTANITATQNGFGEYGLATATSLLTVGSPTLVSSITVTGAGGASTITTYGGTLQMSAEVLPSGATNKAVTWSVTGTGATITVDGLLQAVSDGDVEVKATAKDGSNVSGTKNITITNQTIYSVSFASDVTATQETSGSVNVALNISGAPSTTASVDVIVSSGTATGTDDYTISATTITFPVSSTASQNAVINIVNDGNIEADEYLVIKLGNFVNCNVGTKAKHNILIKDNDRTALNPNSDLELEYVTSIQKQDGESAEIVAYDENSMKLFAANITGNNIEVIDFSNPASPVLGTPIDLASYGLVNSVGAHNGIVAAAVENATKGVAGKVYFFNASNGSLINQIEVGMQPDMVTFTPDGNKVLTANEGEPGNDFVIDPEGSISIIDISGGVANITQANVTQVGFTSLNMFKPELMMMGVRIYGNFNGAGNSTVAQDLEPEYITFSDDSKYAYVTLQENNAIVGIDLINKTIINESLSDPNIFPLGSKDYSLIENASDFSDVSTAVNLANYKIWGLYLPDGIGSYNVNGKTYLVTANEGDAREWGSYKEEIKIKDMNLDATAYPNAADLKSTMLAGNLRATKSLGDTDSDGDYDKIYTYGSRSFSIWDTTGTLIYDSKNDFERYTSESYSNIFNADNSTSAAVSKDRSDNKGPEPEGVEIATIEGQTYAFIGLERIGGVMVYNITDPANPVFEDYKVNRTAATGDLDDLGPEGLHFIGSEESPDGSAYLVVANEISSSLSIFKIKIGGVYVSSNVLASSKTELIVYPNPVRGDFVQFNKTVSGQIMTIDGKVVKQFKNTQSVSVGELAKGIYYAKTQEGEIAKIVCR